MNREAAFITLVSGDRFHPFAPNPEVATATNIATGLANECRWASQMRWFYCVAQHCVLVREVAVRLARTKYGLAGRAIKVVGLLATLHDAAEALGFRDLPTPVKRQLPHYEAAEHNCLARVVEHHLRLGFAPEDWEGLFAARVRNLEVGAQVVPGWTHAVPEIHAAVWDADAIVLATEHRDLRPEQTDTSGWHPTVDPLPNPIAPWSPEVAKVEWLRAYSADLGA